jgi:hypothetical protein
VKNVPPRELIQITADNFIVSDGDGAVDVLHGAGGFNIDARRVLTNLSRRKKVLVSNEGWIVAEKISSRRLKRSDGNVTERRRIAIAQHKAWRGKRFPTRDKPDIGIAV